MSRAHGKRLLEMCIEVLHLIFKVEFERVLQMLKGSILDAKVCQINLLCNEHVQSAACKPQQQ